MIMRVPLGTGFLSDQLLMSKRNRWIIYGLFFSFAILVRIACFTGLLASDDVAYSYYGQLLAQGTYSVQSSHLGLRVGLTIPVAIVYRLCGVTEWTTILVPLLASAASVSLLVVVGRRLFPPRAALLSGLLMLTFPVCVRYATTLVPEPVMEFWILLGLVALLISHQNGKATMGFLAGICFGVAYLSKEIALFVGAAMIIYSVFCRRWKLCLAMLAGLSLIGLMEHALYFVQTGDWLYRSHVIGESQVSYFTANEGPIPLAWRLLKAYPRTMLLPNLDLGLHSVMALLLAMGGILLIRREASWLLFLWAAVPMIYLNFGSASLTQYLPLPVSPRYVSLIYAPIFLLAGAFFHHRWLPSLRWRAIGWAAIILVAATGFSCALITRGHGYSTEAVAALRLIKSEAERNNVQVVRFEGKHAKRWRCTFDILSGLKSNSTECGVNCVVVQSDDLGNPYAIIIPNAQPEHRLEPGPCYPF
jgi:4-amino-4-deoxy-L-arabinose transferase-like glycosyltransferase